MIDPTKLSLFYEIDEIRKLRLKHILSNDPIDNMTLSKLLNTCQWMMETVNRMEDNSDWWFINADPDLKDKYMREVHGWTDKDFEKCEQKAKECLKTIQYLIDKKNAGL